MFDILKNKCVVFFKNPLAFNIFSSFIFKGIGIILNFVMVPLFLKYLGKEFYGLWILILSITNWIYTFDIGIGNELKNKISEYIAKKDQSLITKDISCGYFGITTVSTIFFVIIYFLINQLNLRNILNVDILSEQNLKILLLINIFFVCINFVFSLCNNIFYGYQNGFLVSINSVISQIFSLCFIMILFYTEKKSILLLSIVYGLAILLAHLILTIFGMHKYKSYRISSKLISYIQTKKLLKSGGRIFIVQICGLLIFSTDNFIISYFLGVKEVTDFNIVNKLFTIPLLVLNLILAQLWPAVSKAYHENNKIWIEKTLKKMKKIFLAMVISVFIMILFGKKIISIWTMKEICPTNDLIITCGISAILTGYSGIYSTPLFAIKTDRKMIYLCLIQAILNIIVSYIFIKKINLGASGVVLGTCVAMATNIYFLPKWLNEKIKKLI